MKLLSAWAGKLECHPALCAEWSLLIQYIVLALVNLGLTAYQASGLDAAEAHQRAALAIAEQIQAPYRLGSPYSLVGQLELLAALDREHQALVATTRAALGGDRFDAERHHGGTLPSAQPLRLPSVTPRRTKCPRWLLHLSRGG